MQSSVMAGTRGAVVGGELITVVVNVLSQHASAGQRKHFIAVFDALGTTFARFLLLLGKGTMNHGTGLFCALQATVLALTL